MKKLMKYSLFVVAAIVILVAAAVAYVSFALPNVGEAPEMEVSITPQKVERGKYLAYNVMMCADCHSVRDFSIFSGPPTPGTEFAGGDVFDHNMGFPGRFTSSNITPYGIGDWTDGELFRLITTGVKRDGNPIFPVMPYHKYGQMDSEDIEAVIAYLRTIDPVENDHPESKPDFPVNFIMRTMPKKAGLNSKPPTSDTVAYGKYMATAAACFDCHTNFRKGKFVGPEGGGGREFHFPDGSIVRAPNITPHETGINQFTKESFVQRFKMYTDSGFVLPKVNPGEFQTIMPWYMYSGMTEEDLSAIYAYLQTLEPHDNMVVRFTPAQN
ncbi:MAG: c-type cytochrome [Tangfeifania sp.]